MLVESIVAAKVKALESGIEESLRSHLCASLKVEIFESHKSLKADLPFKWILTQPSLRWRSSRVTRLLRPICPPSSEGT